MSAFDRIKISEMTQVSASGLNGNDILPILIPTGSGKFENRKVKLSDLSIFFSGSNGSGLVSSSLQFNDTDDVTFRNITASNITASALFISGSQTSIFIGNVEVTGSLTITSSATFHNIGPTILEGPTTASIISASVFIGDGSQLSGISAGGSVLEVQVFS